MENLQEFVQKELLYAFETSYNQARLYDIAERYGFLDKLDLFSEIIAGTLYGRIPVSTLSATLKKELGVSDEVAQYINIEIDRELFSEVRGEFNVAQGLITIDEYEKELREYAEQKGFIEPEEEAVLAPQKTEPSPVAEKDPIASSVLDQNNNPTERKSDPYREPID